MENMRYSVRPCPSPSSTAKSSRADVSRDSVHITVEPDIIVQEAPESTSTSEVHFPGVKVEHDPLSVEPPDCLGVIYAGSNSSSVVPSDGARDSEPLLMKCEVKLEHITDDSYMPQSTDHEPDEVEVKYDLKYIQNETERSYDCDVCSRRFDRQSDLWAHAMVCLPASLRDEESVAEQKKLSLYVCGAPVLQQCSVTLKTGEHEWRGSPPPTATSKTVLQQPSASHSQPIRKNATKYTLLPTGERLYTCDICGKQFTVARNLNKHKRNHTGEKPCSCKICHRKFSQASNLKTHSLIHAKEKRFSCDLCELKFTQLGNLKRHYSRVHSEVEYYNCEVCKKKFTELAMLEKHSETHEGVKLFSCDVCYKKFTQKGNMETHKRIHTGFKPFSCDGCDREFTALSNLIRHKLVHKTISPHECGVCKKSFKRLDRLLTHARIHERPKSSKICGKVGAIYAKKRIKG